MSEYIRLLRIARENGDPELEVLTEQYGSLERYAVRLKQEKIMERAQKSMQRDYDSMPWEALRDFESEICDMFDVGIINAQQCRILIAFNTRNIENNSKYETPDERANEVMDWFWEWVSDWEAE